MTHPYSERQPFDPARANRLALSILEHALWCPGCMSAADLARMALMGATIDELRQIRSS